MNRHLFGVVMVVLIGVLVAMVIAFVSLLNLTQTMLQASAHPTVSNERLIPVMTPPPLDQPTPERAASTPIIQTKPWDMEECLSPEYCGGSTNSVADNSLYGGWYPAAYYAKLEVDYGQTLYDKYLFVAWFWDGSFTSACRAAIYVSNNHDDWIALTTDLTPTLKGTYTPGGWAIAPISTAFRYLRVHVGQGIGAQNCGWVGIAKVMPAGDQRGVVPGIPGVIQALGSGFDDPTGEYYNYFASKVGIGTLRPGDYLLNVNGQAYAANGWRTARTVYAEWFESEGPTQPGDVIGIDLTTGKVRRYRPGDKFVGVQVAEAAVIGNQLEAAQTMQHTHTLVGLFGQIAVNPDQVVTQGRIQHTRDGVEIGVVLNDGLTWLAH